MAFLESPRFPEEVSPWLIGGEEFKTEIVATQGGFESRNSVWAIPLRRYRLSNAMRLLQNAVATKAFFRAVGGRANAFRVKDQLDYFCTTQTGVMTPIGAALGVAVTFQLGKQYVFGGVATVAPIKKPVVGTVVCYVNGALTAPTLVDYATGQVTFAAAPPVGASVVWSGEFDIPCRFDVDWLQIGIDQGGTMIWDNIQLVEVRL